MKLAIPEELETNRIRLRRLRYEDAEEIFFAYASKQEATRYVSWATHQSLRDTRAFLDYSINGWGEGKDYSFSIRLKRMNRLIGGCGLIHDGGSIQFGYILSPTYWGQGYATEVCSRLMEMIKSIPEVTRVSTFVDVENVASAKVLLKCGLVQEARLEKWHKFVNQENQPKDCLVFRLPIQV